MPSDAELTSDFLHTLLDCRDGMLFWKVNRGKAHAGDEKVAEIDEQRAPPKSAGVPWN